MGLRDKEVLGSGGVGAFAGHLSTGCLITKPTFKGSVSAFSRGWCLWKW